MLILPATTFGQSVAVQADAAKSLQPAQSAADTAPPIPALREIAIPGGTPLEIEAVYTVSSRDMKPGDLMSFHVLIPVRIDGVTVIDKYSLVTGRVVMAKRGGHWGKAGKLTWIMQDVVATDLTRVPLLAYQDGGPGEHGVKGTSHGAEVATRTIVFGALLFPVSPLALMSGFKRGDDAVLPQGKRFVVFVQTKTIVKLPVERPSQ
ncbi:MAG: hypothetical protein AABM67_05245 [Acidobacteriota bacterium]